MAILQYPAESWESDRQNRSCLPEIATAPLGPRNDTSGKREVHQRPHAVELPSTRRSLSAATFFSRAAALCNERRYTPYFGACHFNDALYESAVSAGPGCPLPYSTPRSAGFFSLYHIPREKSTLSEKSGLSP